jgi:hypothetical protein
MSSETAIPRCEVPWQFSASVSGSMTPRRERAQQQSGDSQDSARRADVRKP